MKRCMALACALGLWAGPVAAQELRLDPPRMSAQADRCGSAERARCGDARERALDTGLTCDACRPPPMPAELTAPAGAAPREPKSPECLPRASGSAPASCVQPPRLDLIPRP